MKLKVLVVYLAALGTVFAAACGGGVGGGDAVDDFLKMLPGDAEGMIYVNVPQLLDDDELDSFRWAVYDELDDADFLSDYGVLFSDLAYIAFAEIDIDDIYFLGGLDAPESLMDELDEQGYDEGEIRGVEVWVDTSRYWEAFAFLPNGSVLVVEEEDLMDNLLRRRDRGSLSLYDETSGVLSRLSSQSILTAIGSCTSGCAFGGASVQKKGSRDAKVVFAEQYDSNDDAEDSYDDLLEDFADDVFDDDYCDRPKLRRDGSVVSIEAVCSIDYSGQLIY